MPPHPEGQRLIPPVIPSTTPLAIPPTMTCEGLAPLRTPIVRGKPFTYIYTAETDTNARTRRKEVKYKPLSNWFDLWLP